MTLAKASLSPLSDRPAGPRPAHFTKAEYLGMVERGIFTGLKRRVFLFRGELIEMPPMGWEHFQGVRKVSNWAFAVLRPQFEVCVQCPFDAPDDSSPEPDIAIYNATQIERRPHPNAAELIIEISDTSRKLDAEKAQEYAVNVREYWVLDVVRRVVEVYRNPHDDPAALYGRRFDAPLVIAEFDSIAPLCEAAAVIRVRELLPST